jgi:hypothetical protein
LSLSPISLARTLPGVILPSGSPLYNNAGNEATQFSINGQRPRANNYLLDGTENNDISITGVAQPFNIADAVEEASAQTGNFGVEFGRAGGGILNVVTKSGTNKLAWHDAMALPVAAVQFGVQSRQAERNSPIGFQ